MRVSCSVIAPAQRETNPDALAPQRAHGHGRLRALREKRLQKIYLPDSFDREEFAARSATNNKKQREATISGIGRFLGELFAGIASE
jgi:hypothetical protein